MQKNDQNFMSKIFVTWMWEPIKHYQNANLSKINMIQAPDQRRIVILVQELQIKWNQEIQSHKPSFSKTIIKTVYKPYLKAAFFACISQLLAILQSILIVSIVEYQLLITTLIFLRP